jgi:hypothetical protein
VKWAAFMVLAGLAMIMFANGRASGQSPCGPQEAETWPAWQMGTPTRDGHQPRCITIDGTLRCH